MKTITVRGQPILLDQLLAKEFGPQAGRAMLTAALELNPGLASAGAVIPVGTVVTLPDRPVASVAGARPVVSLFG